MFVVEVEATRFWIKLLNKVIKHFTHIVDVHILDFYVDGLWEGLPLCWQEFLSKLTLYELGEILEGGRYPFRSLRERGLVVPLSLSSLVKTIEVLSLERKINEDHNLEIGDDEFLKVFNRHVKAKKRHEIQYFSSLVSSLCEETDTKHLFDVGSGIGHLARYLTYGCGINLTCVDNNPTFGLHGGRLDEDLELYLKRKGNLKVVKPSHLCLKLELDKHESHFNADNNNFGLIGLHTCGDLGPVLIHNYVNSKSKFVVSVGCCYMKLTKRKGFPLSEFGKNVDLELSYNALEVSCHAIEQFATAMKNGQVALFKTHAYRGILEKLLVSKCGIQGLGLKGVSGCDQMSFQQYALKALANRKDIIELTSSDLETPEVIQMLKDEYKVGLFYSLRLLLANLVETLVILDRALFIKENDEKGKVKICALFDPIVSPRNFAVIGRKTV